MVDEILMLDNLASRGFYLLNIFYGSILWEWGIHLSPPDSLSLFDGGLEGYDLDS